MKRHTRRFRSCWRLSHIISLKRLHAVEFARFVVAGWFTHIPSNNLHSQVGLAVYACMETLREGIEASQSWVKVGVGLQNSQPKAVVEDVLYMQNQVAL